MAWLIAGLGNPGERFARTRHNVGAMVVDEIARRSGTRLRKVRFVPAEAAEIREATERVILARSQRYMNEAGPSFASLARKHGIAPDHVIAVHDEIDLPFGAMRVKVGGSTAGHNGLRSLQGGLRSPDFHRIRVGVGRPTGRQDPADFVLRPFSKAEEPDVPGIVDDAADAALSLVRDGLAATQDRYNRARPTPRR
jgi:peptidyl-tRNA hydrolase, PTH1 family